MSILVSKGGKGAQRLERTVIQQEEYLQQYIYENPESLPLHEVKEEIKLLILAREFPTGSGPIDALGIDAEGEIYIIETKLYKNPDKRRVIAQMLDYGASLWSNYTDPAEFITKLEEVVAMGFGMSLGDKLEDFYGIEKEAIAEILQVLRQNISDGKFWFVVLMDRMDDRLKDLIRFVNQNSRFDVLGVELDFYKHGELEILIPNLFGAEVKKEVGPSSIANRRSKWDAERYFRDARQRMNPEDLQKLKRLYEWSSQYADEVVWGTGAKIGSFNAKFYHVHTTKSVYTIQSTGELILNFKWLTESGLSESSAEYARRLGEAFQHSRSFNFPDDYMNRFIGMSLEDWASDVDQFISALESIMKDTTWPPIL